MITIADMTNQKNQQPMITKHDIQLDPIAITLAQNQVRVLITYVHQYTNIPLDQLLLLDQRSFQIDWEKDRYWFYVQSTIDNTMYGIVVSYDATKNTFSQMDIMKIDK